MTALKDPSLFVSKASGTAISKDKAISVKEAKTQCAKGVKEEDLNSQSTTAKNGAYGLIAIQIVAQLLLKGTMKDLWGMFFTLQIICYLAMYNIVLPANSQIFQEQFTNLIEFELLQPEPLIQIFYPEFNLMAFIKGAKIMVTNKDQEASVLNDLRLWIFLIFLGLVVLLVLLIVRLFSKFKDKINEILKKQKEKWLFN